MKRSKPIKILTMTASLFCLTNFGTKAMQTNPSTIIENTEKSESKQKNIYTKKKVIDKFQIKKPDNSQLKSGFKYEPDSSLKSTNFLKDQIYKRKIIKDEFKREKKCTIKSSYPIIKELEKLYENNKVEFLKEDNSYVNELFFKKLTNLKNLYTTYGDEEDFLDMTICVYVKFIKFYLDMIAEECFVTSYGIKESFEEMKEKLKEEQKPLIEIKENLYTIRAIFKRRIKCNKNDYSFILEKINYMDKILNYTEYLLNKFEKDNKIDRSSDILLQELYDNYRTRILELKYF